MAVTRAAVVQMDVALGEVGHNQRRVLERLDRAAEDGAATVVFPECALTGYGFASVEEARPVAREAVRAASDIVAACRERCITAIVGTLEEVEGGVFNAALIAASDGEATLYRKCHLPYLGIDKVASRGGSLRAIETPEARLGVLICYDLRFPEASRRLALDGAEVLCVPTNWPEGADTAPDFVTRARAFENRVYVLAANRIGAERGFTFIGRSQIVEPSGRVLAEAGPGDETILMADLNLDLARQKRVIIRPGEFEMDLIGDRRSDLYAG